MRAYRPIALAGLLAAVLVLLAVLQYRWSLEISRAERTRIEASLNTSMTQFRQEFYRELAQVATAFHSDPTADADDFWLPYAERYEVWERTASRPDLVANVYASHANGQLLRLADGKFDPVDWPPSLANLKTREETEPRQPFVAWTLEQRIPALVRPIFNVSGPGRWRRRQEADTPPPPPRTLLGFVIVELNRGALDRLLGELAQRYFTGPEGFDFNVAVMGDNSFVYRSDAQLTPASLNPPDAREALLPVMPPREDLPPRGTPGRMRNRSGGFPQRPRGAIILPSPDAPPWQLLARHVGGSLESVVAANRQRSLLLSFGVLLVLAVSMALVIVSAQRARRLARLQMEFVAGVSHELRTPVAVICSAADNLADGLVGAKDQVKEYGTVIRNEGRRLAGMIEQILRFAAGQSHRATYDLRPVPVAEAIDSVAANVAGLPEAEGITMEREIAPDLPPVEADPAALTRCLENLVLNAFKYGGGGRWVRVRAEKAANGSRVRIAVEDHGAGIDPADLPHIFEPFYRGKAAQAAQIHGTGLGLSLARDIAEGMSGRLEAASEPGHGSTFTLELPAAVQA